MRRLVSARLWNVAWAALALIAVLIGWRIGMRPRVNPLASYAHDAILAELNGEVAHLLRYAHPEEIELNDLTTEKVKVLFDEIISRPYKGWRKEGSLLWYASNSFCGDAEQPGRTEDGVPLSRSVQVRSWDGAPRRCLTRQITQAWLFQAYTDAVKKGDANPMQTPGFAPKAILNGIAEDGQRLRQLGVRYFAIEDWEAGELKFQSLDQMTERQQCLLSDPHQAQDPSFRIRYEMTVTQARMDKEKNSE